MSSLKTIIRNNANPGQRKFIVNLFLFLRSAFWGIAEVLWSPFVLIGALLFRQMRKGRFKNFPLSKRILFGVGVYPILDHYYDPMFNWRHLRYSLRKDRNLPGIDLNIQEQLALLNKFKYGEELMKFPVEKTGSKPEFAYNYGQFKAGDAEYLYSMVRHFRPRQVVEIGCGQSTLMMLNAIRANKADDGNYDCNLTCVEPYENHWLEQLGINVIRKVVEELDMSVFKSLNAGDILFIDSSHIIRPQGDVLFEYLEILPCLKPGVIVHVHDIFTPRDYPDDWVRDAYFWNEQYLLEAFLSFNRDFKIIGALNFLTHNYIDQVKDKCPVLGQQMKDGAKLEPGSIWLQRV